MSTSIQKYTGYTPEEADDVTKATETGGKFFKVKDKKAVIRLLPAPSGKKPLVVTYSHYVELLPGVKGSTVIFNCPAKMARRRCPLCERAQTLVNTGSKLDRDRAFQLFPKLRVYANILDRSNEDTGVQVYPFGKKVLEQLNAIREDDGDFCNISDTGFDIIVRREGSGMTDTVYMVKRASATSPLLDDASDMEKLLDTMLDLSMYARVPTESELRDIMNKAKSAGRDEPEVVTTAVSRSSKRTEVVDTTGEDADDAWE